MAVVMVTGWWFDVSSRQWLPLSKHQRLLSKANKSTAFILDARSHAAAAQLSVPSLKGMQAGSKTECNTVCQWRRSPAQGRPRPQRRRSSGLCRAV